MSVIIARRGGAALKALSLPFADNEWADIIKACQSGTIPDTWAVGDNKMMTINGIEYQIDIIGKDHDAYADGTGKAPLTFQLNKVFAGTYTMNANGVNTGGWADSTMRLTHLPAVIALLPAEVQAALRAVTKGTSEGQTSPTIETTNDKAFLLSEFEVFGQNSWSKSGEGAQYEYYANGNSKAKTASGGAFGWWLRSPEGSGSTRFCCVDSTGAAGYATANDSHYISFAFCF